MNLPSRLVLLLVALAFQPMLGPAYAAEAVCNPKWEYKVIHTQSPDRVDTRQAISASKAASDIETILNRLGTNGWELASEHRLVVTREFDQGVDKAWTARLEPESALLKRQSGCQ